ncbi:MAG: hypothetical protein JSW62_01100 [Thermoplasmatales archaeon]|nr:MAG: hypothetical protein JSW62_01100 [Thermoplasmatales archaeon]
MAKKRKGKEEDEELDFNIPKFDEEKFLKKERQNIKTVFISSLFGIFMAIVCFGFWILLKESGDLRWTLILLVAVVNSVFLRYFFIRFNFDLTTFGKKGWFSSYAVYFFSWLLILMVLVNPPFYDAESPHVEVLILPDMQEIGGTIKIVARISDNAGVQNIDFILTYPDDTMHSITDFAFEDDIFMYTYEGPENLTGEGTYSFKINVTDINGHTTEEEGFFIYANDAIKLAEPIGADIAPGPSVTYSTTIKFDVGTDVSRFYYVIDNINSINVTKVGDFYETYPKFNGWVKNKNVTLKACADVIYYFENRNQQFNNTILDSDIYYFNVSGAIEIGAEEPPEIDLPKYQPIQVPGFEMIIFIISFIAVILVFKYRKRDR